MIPSCVLVYLWIVDNLDLQPKNIVKIQERSVEKETHLTTGMFRVDIFMKSTTEIKKTDNGVRI